MWALGYEGHFPLLSLCLMKSQVVFLENIWKFVLILKKQLPTL